MTKLIQLSSVTVDRITQAYSGRPGCACGCQGKWYQAGAQKKRILTAIRKAAPESVQLVNNSLGAGLVISLDTKVRTYILHVDFGSP